MAIDSLGNDIFQDPETVEFVMISRPVFNRDMDIFAYTLLFNQCTDEECNAVLEQDSVNNAIIANGFALAASRLEKDKMFVIGVTVNTVMSNNVLAFPHDKVVLGISALNKYGDAFLRHCNELKMAGYTFLVDDFDMNAPCAQKLLEIADFIKISLLHIDGQALIQIKKGLAPFSGKLIAADIKTWEVYEGCKYLGFDYFEGEYFCSQESIVGKFIPSRQATHLRLMRLLVDSNVNIRAIITEISQDHSLTVRLLQFVNAASFRSGEKVNSLSRAASLVGFNALKKWAITAALYGLDTREKGQEIAYRTIHNAIFLSMLGRIALKPLANAESLYLLGLLNNIDSLLGMNMKDVVQTMPLCDEMRRALTRNEKEPLTNYLFLLDAVWGNDWRRAQSLLGRIGVSLKKSAQLYMHACEAASRITSPETM